MTLDEFITAQGITASAAAQDIPAAEPGESKSDRDWRLTASHWLVTLRMGGASILTPFRMGSGHKGKQPTASDVLSCLQSDCQSIESSRDFEDWARDLGYDTDSRKAEKTYRACQDECQKIRVWLGLANYATFLECTEA